ncbi:chemotaxis protein CheW [Shewanella psychropiezotolerans]|uniref:Chemotaxis protein CheW n=1 Tax=Shewanella psychropiezotolerans TaxID=2593655 RepID=A0ABX5WWM0_9GAMM|nr:MULTISPECIES: chemotaxis protein CheW [Shewanella]MPY24879.1 chemotaxis protein CheW [Shewanella sp. YLB-07]QDO83487.1 chemotaxis protein CheW [Shewanella psychropiezotolerans]
MSSLVDEAVFDYFNILLTEVEEQTEAERDQGAVAKLTSNEAKAKIASVASNQGRVNSRETIVLGKERISHLRQEEIFPSKAKVAELSPAVSILTQPKLKEIEPQLDKQALEQLLAPVFKTKVEVPAEVKVKVQIEAKAKVKTQVEAKAKIQPQIIQEVEIQQLVAVTPPKVTKDLLETLDDEFQVLFFKVAGLTLAVPLVSLGGIVKLERVNHIMGRPDWYKGVQAHRGSQLNVVDTCAWVMPEKYDSALAETVNYQYVVLLEDSNWGLTCESLVNAVKIKKSAVNWRSNAGKRPWLAGVVREQMCGILHVHALIELLNSGLSSQDPVG